MINIIIADQQAIFRAGIAKVLAVEEDLRIVGQPQSFEQMMNSLEKLRWHVLLISGNFAENLPLVVGSASRQRAAILVLADHGEPAAQYLSLGVQGVVCRSIGGQTIVDAVRRLARGETYVQIASSEQPNPGEDMVGTRVRDRLSDKELKIVAAVVRGYKNREIAMQLYTSEQVIKNALRNIFDKIGVSDRLELALFVLHHRILAQATASVTLQTADPPARRVSRNGPAPKAELPEVVPPPSVQ